MVRRGFFRYVGALLAGLGLGAARVRAKENRSEEVERLTVQLAGCSAAANGATKYPAKPYEWGWSVAYQDVLELRLKYETLHDALTAIRDEVSQFKCPVEACYFAMEQARLALAAAGPIPARSAHAVNPNPSPIAEQSANL